MQSLGRQRMRAVKSCLLDVIGPLHTRLTAAVVICTEPHPRLRSSWQLMAPGKGGSVSSGLWLLVAPVSHWTSSHPLAYRRSALTGLNELLIKHQRIFKDSPDRTEIGGCFQLTAPPHGHLGSCRRRQGVSKFEQHKELLAAKEWIEIDETDIRDLLKQSVSQLYGAAMLQKILARVL